MSDTLGLGKIITTEQHRDAIHVAVAPVIANRTLFPGQHIGFTAPGAETVDENGPNIGIVDPFIVGRVQKGERFWMYLYPGSITSLRHDWTHPAFVPPVPSAVENADNENLDDDDEYKCPC